MVQSVNAWASVMRARCTKLLPSRLNRGWGFSPITNARSDGRLLGPSSPSLGNVIVVPGFHPGFTLISKIFSSIRVERPSGFNRFRVTFNRLEQPKYSASNVTEPAHAAHAGSASERLERVVCAKELLEDV